MQALFAALATGAGFVGVLCAVLMQRALPPPRGILVDETTLRSRGRLFVRIHLAVTTFLLFLLTLPASKPFSTGLTLGWGVLIGGGLGLLTLTIFRDADEADHSALIHSIGVLSAASLGPALILLIFRGYPNEALMGCALGSLFIGTMSGSDCRSISHWIGGSATMYATKYRRIELYAMTSTLLAAGSRLAIDHFPRSSPSAPSGGYWVVPSLLMLVGCLALLLLPENNSPSYLRKPLIPGLIAGAVVTGVEAALQSRLLPALSWPVELYGLLAFGFVLFLLSQRENSTTTVENERSVGISFGVVLLALSVMAVSYRQLGGYGQTLALIPALLLIAPAWLKRNEAAESLTESLTLGAFTIGLLMALLRIFMERAGRGTTLDFQQFYNLFGLVLGASVVFIVFRPIDILIVRISQTGKKRNIDTVPADNPPFSLLLGHYLALVLTPLLLAALAAAPLVLAALWGAKATGAYLAGLLLSEIVWMLLVSWVRGEERQTALIAAPHLYLLASALVAVQFTPLVLSLALTRSHKLILVGVLAGVAILAVAISAKFSPRPASGDPLETSV